MNSNTNISINIRILVKTVTHSNNSKIIRILVQIILISRKWY